MVHSPPPVTTSDPISSLVIDNPAAMCLLNASNVTMTCQTNGFPRPQVRFLMGRNVITPGERNFLRVSQTFADQVGLISGILIFESPIALRITFPID